MSQERRLERRSRRIGRRYPIERSTIDRDNFATAAIVIGFRRSLIRAFFIVSSSRGTRARDRNSLPPSNLPRSSAFASDIRVRVSQHLRQEQEHQRHAYQRRRANRGRGRQVEFVLQFLRHVHVNLVEAHVFDEFRKLRGVDEIALRRPDSQRRFSVVVQQVLHHFDILRHEARSYGISYRLGDMVFLQSIEHLRYMLCTVSTIGDVELLAVPGIYSLLFTLHLTHAMTLDKSLGFYVVVGIFM